MKCHILIHVKLIQVKLGLIVGFQSDCFTLTFTLATQLESWKLNTTKVYGFAGPLIFFSDLGTFG